MDVGDHFRIRIKKNDGLAVRLPDRQGETSDIRDDGVTGKRSIQVVDLALLQHPDVFAMHLLHRVKSPGVEKLPDLREIPPNVFGAVPDAVTRIETVKWGGAYAAVACANGVDQFIVGGKSLKLEVEEFGRLRGMRRSVCAALVMGSAFF